MANNLKGLTIKIGADTTALNTALSNVNKSTKNLQKELKQVDKLLKLDPGNTELLKQKQDILTQSIAETKQKLDTLREAEAQLQEQFEKGEIGEEQYRALQREIVETEQKLESLEKEAKEFGSVSAQVAKATGEKFKEVGDKISGAGKTLTAGVTAPIVGLGALAVKTAADFDSSMSQVQATMGIASDATSKLNGETVNTMSSLRELAKEMGASTAFSASECADAMNYLALAGYNTQEIYDTLPTVLNLAAAGSIDLASASDMVTDAMSALGMETNEADKMVDQMAKTASSTNTSVAQLGEAILTIGATAKSIKGGTAELNTALGILANNGIKGAEGGTHLRNVILSLQTPTDAAYVAMTELGVAVYDAEGDMRSLNDILGDLNTSMDGMTSEEKANIISTIFNKTDLASVNALLSSTGETWDALQESITGSAGSAQQMADTQLDNLAGQITILKSSLEGLAISFGELLMPYIQQVVEKVQSAIEWFNGLDEGTKKLILTIAGIAAVVGPVLVVVGSVMSAVGTILTMVPAIVAGITAVGTAINTALGPIGWIALAIGAIVTVLITLWNTNEDFRNAVIGIWEGIKNFFIAVTEGIKTAFVMAWEGIKAVWNGVVGFFTNIWEGIKAVFAVVAAVLSGDFGTAVQLIKQVFEPVISFFTGIWERIKAVFANVGEHFRSVGAHILEGLWNGISDKIGWLKDRITGIIDRIKSWFTGKDGFDEASPSKWAKQVGEFVDLGLARGLLGNLDTIKKAATVVTGGVMKPLEMLDLPDLEKNLAYSVLAPSSTQATPKTAATEAVTGAITSASYSSDDTAQQIADAVSAALQAGLATLADTLFAAMPKDVILQINAKQIARATWSAFEAEARSRNRLFAPTRGQVVRLVNGGGV